jgi:ribosome-binding protein aMBF1 (putative translation factor)
MPEYSRPLGDAVKCARKHQGLTKKQLADKINVDERTITSIETYQANTTMAVLYPLLRTLNIDPREVFNPEMEKESSVHYQLRLLLGNCTEGEAAILLSVCDAVLSALHSSNGITLE